MISPHSNVIVWLDLETSGLDTSDLILEVGMVVTDHDLNELDHWARPVSYPPAVIDQRRREADHVVRNMHDTSHLWVDCIAATDGLSDVMVEACDWLDHHAWTGAVMGGSGLHFDRRMLATWGPDLLNRFHYRNLDVSNLRTAVAMWAPDAKFARPEAPLLPHRAIPDLHLSILEAVWYRNNVFDPAQLSAASGIAS